MLYFQNVLIVLVFCLIVISQPFPITKEIEAVLYLQKFGYLEDCLGERVILEPDSISNALKKFQWFSGINETGLLDNETITLMKSTRCKVEDGDGHYPFERRNPIALRAIRDRDDGLRQWVIKYHPKEIPTISPLVDEQFSSLSPSPATSDIPDLCQNASIDAVTQTLDGSTYVFKGDFYWKILINSIPVGHPRKITDDWKGLEGNLDASLTGLSGKTFFFKGERYWRFRNKKMDTGYPKLISTGFPGIPGMLDAAFVWSGNGKPHFFKGDKYWRYDGKDAPVNSKYPKPIRNWEGLPNSIDAAFQWENNKTYFFKGDEFYRFNDASFEVESGGSSQLWLFDCQ